MSAVSSTCVCEDSAILLMLTNSFLEGTVNRRTAKERRLSTGRLFLQFFMRAVFREARRGCLITRKWSYRCVSAALWVLGTAPGSSKGGAIYVVQIACQLFILLA